MADASRANWQTFRFDQMAIQVKNRVEVPRESGFERYVGLGHLDSGSLKDLALGFNRGRREAEDALQVR